MEYRRRIKLLEGVDNTSIDFIYFECCAHYFISGLRRISLDGLEKIRIRSSHAIQYRILYSHVFYGLDFCGNGCRERSK